MLEINYLAAMPQHSGWVSPITSDRRSSKSGSGC